MKLLVKLIALFAIAILIGYIFSISGGHITIYLDDYRYDLSLLMFVILLIVGYIVFIILTKIIFKIIRIPKAFKNFRINRINRKIEKLQLSAIVSYLDGDYKKATKYAMNNLKQNLSSEQKSLMLKIGYMSSKLANLDSELEQIKQEITKLDVTIQQYIDFADMQFNYYQQNAGLLKDSLATVLSHNKKNVLANVIKQHVS